MSKKMETPSGEIIEVDDSMTPEQMGKLYQELAATGHTGEKYGVTDETPLLVTMGNGAARGFAMLPGIIPELANFTSDVVQYAGGTPWEKTQKIEDTFLAPLSFKSLDENLGPKGLGLYQHMDPNVGFFHRAADFAGELGTGAYGAATKLGRRALIGAFGGGTAGGELVDPMLEGPYKGLGKLVGGLLGGIYGGYRGIDVPEANAPTVSQLFEDIAAGRPRPQPPAPPPPAAPPPVAPTQLELPLTGGRKAGDPIIRPKQGELPFGPGGKMNSDLPPMSEPPPPAPPAPPPVPQPSAAQQQAAIVANDKLKKLQIARAAVDTKQPEILEAIKPQAPGFGARLANRFGLNSAEKAGDIALYDQVTKVERLLDNIDTPPNVLAESIGILLDHVGLSTRIAPHTSARIYGLWRALKRFGGPGKRAELRQAVNDLGTIIRSGAPLPSRGNVVRNEIRGILSEGKKLGRGVLDAISVEKGPNDVILGSGPMIFRRPRSVLADTAEQNKLPDAEAWLTPEDYIKKFNWRLPNPNAHPRDFAERTFPTPEEAPAGKGIETWHVSPARFDKVRVDTNIENNKLYNSGAGGASFGHGNYSAQNRGTRDSYMEGPVDPEPMSFSDIYKTRNELALRATDRLYGYVDPTGRAHKGYSLREARKVDGRYARYTGTDSYLTRQMRDAADKAIEAGERDPQKIIQAMRERLYAEAAKESRWSVAREAKSGPELSRLDRHSFLTISKLLKDLDFMEQKKLLPAEYYAEANGVVVKNYEDYVQKLHELKNSNSNTKWKKTYYKLDLDTTPESLFDLDTPLWEQPATVRGGLLNLGALEKRKGEGLLVGGMAGGMPRRTLPLPLQELDDYRASIRQQLEGKEPERFRMTGEEAYWNAREELIARMSKNPEQELLREGIHGNRYFDGMSRDTQTGTRNFVIWDEDRINILGRSPLAKFMIPGAAGVFFIRESDVPPEYREGMEG